MSPTGSSSVDITWKLNNVKLLVFTQWICKSEKKKKRVCCGVNTKRCVLYISVSQFASVVVRTCQGAFLRLWFIQLGRQLLHCLFFPLNCFPTYGLKFSNNAEWYKKESKNIFQYSFAQTRLLSAFLMIIFPRPLSMPKHMQIYFNLYI